MADLTPEQEATLERWRNMQDNDGNPVTNGYVGDPDAAGSFFQVKGGVPYRMPCPTGLIFNPAVTPGPVCDWRQGVSLDDNPAPRD